MCAFDPAYASKSMVPNMSHEQILAYVNQQMEDLLDMLDGAEDCKWIYQSLIELSMLHKRLSKDWPSQKDQMRGWILHLQDLDPLRQGRWQDLKQSLAV